MSLMREERAIYEEVWQVPAYGDMSPGEDFCGVFLDMIQTEARGSVLDAGCGQGRGALALAAARRFPFTTFCLWDDPCHGAMEWVYCCDVLEHLPEAFTMLAVVRLLSMAARGVFLTVGTQPDVHGAWVGRPLHRTVKPFVWWRDHLAEVGLVVEARDMLMSAAFLVR